MNKLLVTSLVLGSLGGVVSADKKPDAKQTNRQVIDHFFTVVDAKNVDKLGEVDAVDLDMVTPMGPIKGLEGHKQMEKGFVTAFPNFKHTTTRCVESGDLISCEGTFSGDNTGPMMMPDGKSMPATKKKVSFGYLGIARIKDNKVAELKVYFDTMNLMMQLGVIPPPKK